MTASRIGRGHGKPIKNGKFGEFPMLNLDSKQNHPKHWQDLDSIRKKSYLASFLVQFSDSKKHF